ncbi:hypothetical protein CRENBAI_008036, partial [Crenichthys baileyi]
MTQLQTYQDQTIYLSRQESMNQRSSRGPWLPPVPSFLSSLRMQKIQTLSPQENFTDYLLSWLHSGFKSPQASCERTWLTLKRAPLQDHPPGATSTTSA